MNIELLSPVVDFPGTIGMIRPVASGEAGKPFAMVPDVLRAYHSAFQDQACTITRYAQDDVARAGSVSFA